MKQFYANGRSMAQILGWIKPGIGDGAVQDVGDMPVNTQMPNRVRHDGDGVEQGLSTGRPFDRACIERSRSTQGDMQGVRDAQVRNIPHNSSILTIPQNVALVGRGMQEGRDVVASRHSDTLLGTFGKTKVPCPSGIEDGKAEGGGKEEERAEALYRKRLARLQKMEADQKGGKVLSNIQMPNRVRHDGDGVGDVQVRNVPNKGSILTIPQNVALVGRGMQEGRDVVASRHSDTLLGTFGKTKVPCLSGIEDGKAEGGQKEVELSSRGSSRRYAPQDCVRLLADDEQGVGYVISNGQMPNRVRHDGETTQTYTSFIPYITSVSKQILQPMAYGLRLITVLIFSLCLLNSALAQSPALRPSSGGGADARVGEVMPLILGQKVPEEFWTREHLFYINGDTVRKTLEEHRGKLLVLDFWTSGCTKCLLHQKDINHYKQKYANDLLVVMVNSRRSREDFAKIDAYYHSERFARLGLGGLVSIIEDSYLEKLFGHIGYPSYFWINRWEYLQTMTYRNFLDSDYTLPFIDRQP